MNYWRIIMDYECIIMDYECIIMDYERIIIDYERIIMDYWVHFGRKGCIICDYLLFMPFWHFLINEMFCVGTLLVEW